MNDIIRRHDAISAYKTLCQGTACKGCPFFDSKGMTDCRLLRALRKVQSAQPKKGKWEEIKVFPASEIELQSARCSACKRYHTTPYLYNYTHYNFCPHCGARMANEDDNNGTD